MILSSHFEFVNFFVKFRNNTQVSKIYSLFSSNFLIVLLEVISSLTRNQQATCIFCVIPLDCQKEPLICRFIGDKHVIYSSTGLLLKSDGT